MDPRLRPPIKKRDESVLLKVDGVAQEKSAPKTDPPRPRKSKVRPKSPLRLVVLLLLGIVTLIGSLMLRSPEPEQRIEIEAKPEVLAVEKPAQPLAAKIEPPAREPVEKPPVRSRPPPPPAASSPRLQQSSEPKSEILSMLDRRGLTAAMLRAHPTTREPYRAWRAIRDGREAGRLDEAELALRTALQDVSNAELLEAQLSRFRAQLAERKTALSGDQLDALERRYLELRSRLKPDLTRDETRAFARQIAELEVTLP